MFNMFNEILVVLWLRLRLGGLNTGITEIIEDCIADLVVFILFPIAMAGLLCTESEHPIFPNKRSKQY
jgi:hypothetical protein